MAARKTPAKTSKNEVANWQEEMAKDAQVAVEQENTAGMGGGRFISTRSGVLSYEDTPLPGNQMAVVILDSVMENIYYDSDFDADAMSPPACFAFGREADEMEPHENVDKYDEFDRQSDSCEECPMNEWGSAKKGKGKACGNRRRLCVVPAGTYDKKGDLELEVDPEHFQKADFAFMKLPVTSVKGFSSYMRSVSEQFQRPLYGVVTRIYLEPDPKSQFKVHFEMVEMVEDDCIPTIMARHKQAKNEIEFPYVPMSDEEKEAAPARKSSSRKKLTKGKAGSARKK